MVETTEQYRNSINQLKTNIENEPYMKNMRPDIAEGIYKTGNRQADIEVRQSVFETDLTTRQDTLEDDFVAVQQDASTVNPSGAEVAVARGSYPTLDGRLTAKEQEVTSQLEQKETLLKLEGSEDEHYFIQKQLNESSENEKLLFPQMKTIIIKKPLKITKSNTHIDFNGSKILYKGTENLGVVNGINRTCGAIEAKGKLLIETETVVIGIKQNEGIIDPEFYSNGSNVKGLTNPFTKVSKIITDNQNVNIIIKKGDYVHLKIENLPHRWSYNFSDNPARMDIVARVLYVTGSDVYVDVSSDFNFNLDVTGTITKFEPLKNVTIENLNYEDGNDTAIPQTVGFTDRESWVAGINAEYTVNLTINKYKAEKHRFPALMNRMAYNPSIHNFTASNPRLVTAGCGYGMQIISSSHGFIETVRGYGLRHLVDFAGSGHMIVNDGKMVNDWHKAFDCHGQGEFDIVFSNCIGNFTLGNGITEFPEMVGHITLENCKGNVNVDWAVRVTIKNSVLYLDPKTVWRVPKIEIDDSELVFKRTEFYVVASTRGSYLETYFKTNNCSFAILNESNNFVSATTKLFEIDNYETVEVKSVPFVDNKRSHIVFIHLYNCKYVYLDNSNIHNMGFTVTDETELDDGTIMNPEMTLQKRIIRFMNNNFNESQEFSDTQHYLYIYNKVLTGEIILIAKGNHYESIPKMRWLRSITDVSQLYVTANDNYIRGNVGGPGANLGIKEPIFISRKNNDDKGTSTDRSLIKDYNLREFVSAPASQKEYNIVFPIEKVQLNGNYNISLTPSWDSGNWWLTEKTATGFKVNFKVAPLYKSDFVFALINE